MNYYTLIFGLFISIALSAQNFIDTTYQISTEYDIEYGTSVNFAGVQKTLEMDISYPTDDVVPNCGRPLALIIHGGAWAAGSKQDGNIVRMREDFAKRGYVAAAINYRLGYFQTDVSKNCNIDNWNCANLADSSEWIRAWYRAVQDAKGALRYLINNQSSYEIDPSNVFVFGESAGAFISYGVAFMDVESEKPASCYNLAAVNPPHQDYQQTCIDGTSYSIPIANMDLTRPDLGPIQGSLNPTSNPYIIKGVGSLYGGVFSDLFTEKAYFQVPRIYIFHQPNDLIVPFGQNRLLKGFNDCAVATNCVHIQHRPFSYGGSGVNNLITNLSIPINWKPEIRFEATSNNANCLQQALDETTGGHQFDSYWNRTVSMADFFAEVIGANDCATLSLENINTVSNIDIYPNPTNNQLFIKHNVSEVNIYLFDSQGKLLKEQSRVTSGASISIGDLNNGVYYLKVNSDTQNTMHKIIKSEN